MVRDFGISPQQLFQQLLVGLINGSFYRCSAWAFPSSSACSHRQFRPCAFYMVGAFAAYFLLNELGFNYWLALVLSPLIVGALGALVERLLLKRLTGLDPLYSLLLTFGLALVIQGVFQNRFGAPACPTRFRAPSPAGSILASCFCRSIAPGSSYFPRLSAFRRGS